MFAMFKTTLTNKQELFRHFLGFVDESLKVWCLICKLSLITVGFFKAFLGMYTSVILGILSVRDTTGYTIGNIHS